MPRASRKRKKRLDELRRALATGWPPSNPKAATARWHLVQEFAELTSQRVRDVKEKLEDGIPL